MGRIFRATCLSGLLLLTAFLTPVGSSPPAAPSQAAPRHALDQSLDQSITSTRSQTARPTSTDAHHPKHAVKVWLTEYRGRTFRVIQLPRCEHMEAVISYNRRGETKEEAKERLGGVAVCSGAFHNSKSMALADFYQIDGSIVSSATTGRWFFAAMDDGQMDLSGNYALFKRTPGVTALALGQRLAPVLYKDGFSTRFMNQVTDRMALGMSHDYIFIVQGKSDIWRLAEFMQEKLPCDVAVNSDGGHVVRGRAPVHIVFRWREESAETTPSDELESAQSPMPVHAEG